jgi:DNA recombination-dependent growth factor C
MQKHIDRLRKFDNILGMEDKDGKDVDKDKFFGDIALMTINFGLILVSVVMIYVFMRILFLYVF